MAYTPNNNNGGLIRGGNAAAVSEKKMSPLEALLSQSKVKARFDKTLGDKAPLFISGLVAAYNANPKLKEANTVSVLKSAMVAATLDLSCVPSLGQCAIVPYENKKGEQIAQFQVMTRGLVQLAQRSGQYKAINTGKVYEDEYDGEDLLSGEVQFHRVANGFRSQGKEDKVVGYFAYMKTNTGFEHTEYWPKDDVVNHAKSFSKSYDKYKKEFKNGPWKDHFDAMAEKTVLKSCLNHYGPMSVNSVIAQAIADNQKIFDTNGNGSYADNPMSDDAIWDEEVDENGEVVEALPTEEKPAVAAPEAGKYSGAEEI